MYSDEGITGTSIKKREGFTSMIQDALDGKIDMIVTKSISRFARNTVDTLSTVRKLKNAGIEFFLKKKTFIRLIQKESYFLLFYLHWHRKKVDLFQKIRLGVKEKEWRMVMDV